MKKMKNSCNGCRVLRKGCSDDCPLRPSLEWIDAPQAQANATVFLAKFYGRAGLMNLLNVGPSQLRSEVYKTLLEEACGRIINPVHGSVGLIMDGNWNLCEEAVQRVLNGIPITAPEVPGQIINSFNGSDIRHLSKNGEPKTQTRKKFKRNRNGASTSQPQQLHGDPERVVGKELMFMNDLYRTPSNESIASVQTVEGSLVKKNGDQMGRVENNNPNDEMDLKLTLGSYSQLSALADIAAEGAI